MAKQRPDVPVTSSEFTLGIVGSGNIGTAVARLASKASIKVAISNSRGAESLSDLVAELGAGARAVATHEAASESDAVVVSIPFWRFPELPPEPFDGAVVLDTMNYDPARDSAVTSLMNAGGLPGPLLQQHLPGARVVKVFSSIFARHLDMLARPAGAEDRSALPIAGDDARAKQLVADLLDRLGWDSVDTGALADSRRFDLGTPAFVAPYVADTTGNWGQRLPTDPGQPAGAAMIRSLL